MKRDKPDISIKINGRETNKSESPREEERPSQLIEEDKKGTVIADWRDKLASEREQAASHWEAYSTPKKGASLLEKWKRKKQRPRFLYFFSLAGGAVFLGLFFGMALLHLFPGEESASRAAIDMDMEETPIVSQYNDTFIMYVIQAGAFKEKPTGTNMQDRLKTKGYPTVLTHDGDFYYIFTGVAFNKSGLEQLKTFYEEEGLEVYEKTRAIPDPERKEEDSTEREQLLSSKELMFDIEKAMSATNKEEESSWREALNSLLDDTATWEERDNAYADLRASLEKFKEIDEKKPDTIKMQELMMEAVLYYEEAVYLYNEGEQKEDQEEKDPSPS